MMAHGNISSELKTTAQSTFYSIPDGEDVGSNTCNNCGKRRPRPALKHIQSSFKSISECEHDSHDFYRPLSNRAWILTVFLGAFALSVLLLELAIAVHPSEAIVHGVRQRDVVVERALKPRQAEVTNTTLDDQARETPTTLVVTGQPTSSEQSTITTVTPVTPGQPPPSEQLTITTATSVTPGQPPPSEQLTITTVTPVPQPVTSNEPTVQPNPSSQISITSQATPTNQASSQSANSGTFASQKASSPSQATGTAVDASSSNDLASSAIIAASKKPLEDSVSITDGSAIDVVHVSTTEPASQISASTIQFSVLTDSNGDPTLTSEYALANTLFGPSATHSETSTAADFDAQSTSISSNSDRTTSSDSSHQEPQRFTQFSYFLAVYLPTLIAVVLQSCWFVVFITFKMMEPFYQLAKLGGAPAAMTLTADYLSSELSFNITAVLDGHWVMFLAGIVQLNLGLIVTLVSEAMNVKATAYCKTEVSDHQPCNPVWVVNIPIIRAVEVLLVLCIATVLLIMFLNRRRVSGVFSDPSSIATMADLLVHPPLIQQLRDIPPEASKEQIKAELAGHHYMLGTFEVNSYNRYGIIKLETVTSTNAESNGMEIQPNAAMRALKSSIKKISDSISRMHEAIPILPDALCLSLTTGLWAIILSYWCSFSGPFNDWMNSGFGPSITLTALANAIAFFVKRQEQLLRLSRPYNLLAKKSQPASRTILVGTRGTFWASLCLSFRDKEISLALMSTAAICSNILLIILPGVAFTQTQTRDVYKASTWICLSLLTLIFIAQLRSAFKDGKRQSSLSGRERPDSLASGLLRLCASRFVEEKNFKHYNTFGEDIKLRTACDSAQQCSRDQRLRYGGVTNERSYTFRYMEGVDGVHRFMVDEDIYCK